MRTDFKIKFALSLDEQALTPHDDLWSAPLPASRHAFSRLQCEGAFEEDVTYGDYFTAARHFLEEDGYALIRDASGRMTGKAVSPIEIEKISVYLLKHGAFYHPACVVAEVDGHRLSFVLNVAVSTKGREMIAREYRSLAHLNTQRPGSFWPPVFGIGQGLDPHGRQFPMFLGQWLDGFFEFHISGAGADRRHVVLWDTDNGQRRLNHDQAIECLRQAACILAYAYNPVTFEAIRQWHHAAGDFVVAFNEEKISVRMIAARNYAPMIENEAPDVEAMLEALLIFLMEISLKLRLDRLDGVGRVVCHGDHVVPAICSGFFQGLRMAAPQHGLPEDFDVTAKHYIALHDTRQLNRVASAILKNLPAESGERDLLRRKLEHHLSALLRAVCV
ncbi:MAG: hypothetical protein PVH87_26260 [Desulfobacteraceae bacterium]